MADRNMSVTSGRKKSVAQNQVTSVLQGDELPVYTRELTADEEVLAALGYKPEFKREFTLWTSFCVSFAVLGLLPSFAATLYFGMGYAGTAGMVWGFLIAMVFIQCVAMGMAEICSSMCRYCIQHTTRLKYAQVCLRAAVCTMLALCLRLLDGVGQFYVREIRVILTCS